MADIWIVFYYWASEGSGSGQVIQSVHASEEGALLAQDELEKRDPYLSDLDHSYGYEKFKVTQ